MSKNVTTEELENQQEVIEQPTEQEAVVPATADEQQEENTVQEETVAEETREQIALLTADGEVILTADTIEALNDKFDRLKTAAWDKKLAAGAISHDIDNEVYVLQVNVIN